MASEDRYLLGLDAGNTVIKAVLFDCNGRQIASHAIDGHSAYPEPGQVERNLDELWKNGCEAIRVVLERSRVSPSAVLAVGCAGHGNGLYLLDRENRPLLGIQSLDSRAAGLAAELDRESGEALQARCHQRPWPSQTPTLLAWIKRHRPDIYAKIGAVLFCKDYVNFRLTGRLASDISDLSGAGLYAFDQEGPDRALLDLYGLGDALPLLQPAIDPSDVVGRITREAAERTGLREGTPVIGGFFDVVSSAMGSGVCRPGEASIIVGTWSINQVFAERPAGDPAIFMASTFGPGRHVNIESSATSAANLEWYIHRVIGSHDPQAFERCNSAVEAVVPRGDDPLFHPYLFGSRLGAEFRGGYYGLAGWHGEGHLLRAIFEGVAFEHRRHVEVLKGAGLAIHGAVMSGGGSRSPVWPQIMADVLGMPIRVAEARETGALGAAIGAGVAAGVFAGLEDGVSRMTRIVQEYQPDPDTGPHFERRYRLFLDLTDRMRGFWEALQRP